MNSKAVRIMGAGPIGCEFANDLRQAGHRVHVVHPAARPLALLLPEGAGLQCEHGIVVNERLQSSASHLYALGDCAQYASAGGRTLPSVMPIMYAARALAATLAGTPTSLVFPLRPVSIKTPARPLMVSAAHPAQAGVWQADTDTPDGVWRFFDPEGA